MCIRDSTLASHADSQLKRNVLRRRFSSSSCFLKCRVVNNRACFACSNSDSVACSSTSSLCRRISLSRLPNVVSNCFHVAWNTCFHTAHGKWKANVAHLADMLTRTLEILQRTLMEEEDVLEDSGEGSLHTRIGFEERLKLSEER